MIRQRIIFHGRVQGVFFRATTEQLARDLPLTGFVRNCPDGTVELQAQGAQADIDRLLNSIRQHYSDHITSAEASNLALKSDETGFRIER